MISQPCSYCTPGRIARGLKPNESNMVLDGPYDGSEARMTRFICAPCIIKVFDIALRPEVVVP